MRVRQIILNLLSNAVKFTDAGHIQLKVSVQSRLENEVSLRFEIEDTGPGLNADQQLQLFEPFKQADASSTRRHGGTGLGLSICRNLVDLMHGHIGCESEVGKGSTFWIVLPLISENTTEQAPEPTRRLPEDAVLLLERHPVSRAVLSRHLQQLYRTVHLAENVDAASALLDSDGASIRTVVLMTDEDDQETLRWLEKIGAEAFEGKRVLLIAPLGHHPQAPALERIEDLQTISKPIRLQEFWATAVPGEITTVAPSTEHSSTTFAGYLADPKTLRTPRSKHLIDFGSITPPMDTLTTIEPSIEHGHQPRLLLVEDNKVNQKVMALMLRSLGYDWEVANNGEEALEALGRTPFDLILMDCQMPVMDGFEATRRIRTDGAGVNDKGIPIIAMTANAMQGDKDKCIAAGMNDYLAKPAHKSKLETMLGLHFATEREKATI